MNNYPDNLDQFLQKELGAALYNNAKWQGSPDKLWQGMEARLYRNKKEWKSRLIIHIIMAVILAVLYILVCRYPIGEYINQREENKLYMKYYKRPMNRRRLPPKTDSLNISASEFVQTLKKSGFETDEYLQESHTYLIFTKARQIKVNNSLITIFEFYNKDEAENAAAGISKDGYSIRGWSNDIIPNQGNVRTAYISWKRAPHFFRKNNLIVMYSGTNYKLFNKLEDILGNQFAGGRKGIIYRITDIIY